MDKLTQILALGGESSGCFAVFKDGKIFPSQNYGDLLEQQNFQRFSNDIVEKPDKILIDIHPLYNPSKLGVNLGKKWQIPVEKIQHHIAHIHQVAYEYNLKNFIGIALDGTGLGFDGKIWGGEIFKVSGGEATRIGKLEDQTLIGADLAVREPARVLISILNKFTPKEEIYKFVNKFYTNNEFELLYSQLQQNFNCTETSSTGRVLDAVACLLFGINQREFKHEATAYLENNSTQSFDNLKPEIQNNELQTTPLFQYLINNLDQDKKRLASTAQKYIADGIIAIAKSQNADNLPILASGGLSKTKIFEKIFNEHNILLAQKNPPGDGGLSIGQIYSSINLTNTGN